MSQQFSFNEMAASVVVDEPAIIPGLFITATYFFLKFMYLGTIEAFNLIKFFGVGRAKAFSVSYLYTFVFFLTVFIIALLFGILLPELIGYSLDVETILIVGSLLLCSWILLMGIFLRVSDLFDFANFSNAKIYGSQFVVFVIGSVCSAITTWALIQFMYFLI